MVLREVDAYARLAGVYDDIVVDPSYVSWGRFLHGLWLGDLRGVRRVLDVCTGTGLMAAELARLGYEVAGADASAAMLARARTRLGPAVPLWQAALPSLPVEGVFDAAVSTFDGINYVPPGDLAASFAAVGRCLRPGGWWVFDLHTDAMMQFTRDNPVVSGEDHGQRFTITSDVVPATRACTTVIEVRPVEGGEGFVEQHRQWFHADADVRGSLAAAGLRLLGVVDEYTAQPADADTARATWIARVPDG